MFPAALVESVDFLLVFKTTLHVSLPSFLLSTASSLLLPRLLFITPQPILQYLSVSFLHLFLSLHYFTRSRPLHLTLRLSNLLT